MTRRRENRLSTRARNVLVYALFPDPRYVEESTFREWREWAETIRPREAFKAIAAASRLRGYSMRHVLLRAKGGGAVTLREIFTWMGRPDEAKPHVCVCRTCGGRFG